MSFDKYADPNRWANKKLRNDTAKHIKEIRHALRSPQSEKQWLPYLAYIIVFYAILCLIALCSTAHAYSPEEYCKAIYQAENSKSHPYGIMVKYRSTSPKQACINTVTHKYRNWRKSIEETGLELPFLTYLASRYAPIGATNDPLGLNINWIKNVSFFLRKD